MMKVTTLRLGQIGAREPLGYLMALSIFIAGLLMAPAVGAFTLNLVDNGGNPVEGFRWVLQEDTTYPVNPRNPLPIDEQLALNFHKSHHPIARDASGQGLKGNTDASSVAITAPPGRYYVSVLPYSGHALSGKPVEVVDNSETVIVTVQSYPIPTAQIAVYLFHDCYPLNGAPDLPEEEQGAGVCDPDAVDFSNFSVIVEEPAGKYGIAGGPLLQDAFGNPLGTSYLPGCDPNTSACVASLGDGTLAPNPDGTLLVKNLAPGKYGVIVTPPAGWTQTSTIEGTPVIDAWVKANEPAFFVEFGPPGPHVFIGFTQERNTLSDASGGTTVSGTITNMHMSRPTSTELFSGQPFPQCWVAVNENNGVPGLNRYAMPCDADSNFSIPNIPPGSYELKVFDKPLDVVIATLAFTVDPGGTCNGGGSCAFGNVPVFNWNNRLITYLFNDDNQNGFWDDGETNIGAESGPVNIRWRDGTVYQSFPTDFDGLAPFDEAFPWFNWMVAEVGFTNKKATGATVFVDNGGQPDPAFDLELAPQEQCNTPSFDADEVCTDPAINPNTGDNLSRTEVGPVLLEAFQGFLGQTNLIHFGKTDYLNLDFSSLPPKYIGENGGITGVVFNTVTRAENDPQYAVPEEWEPGVPRVQVNLYADGDINPPIPLIGDPAFPLGTGDVDWNSNGIYDADDNVIDDINGVPGIQLADVDNYPLGWGDGTAPRGPEDVDRDDPDHTLITDEAAVFDLGDAIAATWTDSWDDNTPTGCQGQNRMTDVGIADDRCFDGMRNWNQVRPGVFDGGYAFADYDHTHLATVNPGAEAALQAFYTYVNDAGVPYADKLQLGLLPSDYIVEAATPPGYEALREHHKNVDLGDEYIPSPEALPPVCVGPAQPVPELFALSTKDGSGDPAQIIAGVDAGDAAAPFAGEIRPVCDQKKVPLNAAQNAAADFFLVSEVPVAANVTGIILNDLANEFNPNSPNFGEKYAPPLVPVAFYDWNGKPVNRIYADRYGAYNAMVPSTWNANLPQPSGISPNMLLACMNDAGPIPDPANPGLMIVDPNFDSAFSQFCYTFQYMPGSTTYLDTPVLPIAAYTSPTSYPVDCEQPQNTPVIRDVSNAGGTGPITALASQIVIRSMGTQMVANPEWDGVNPATRLILRDYGFGGTPGTVELQATDGSGPSPSLTGISWADDAITATVSGGPPGEYQVVVANSAGTESPIGVTLTVAATTPGTINVPAGGSIQDAVDAANPGDLILVPPGEYDELVVMWKPVKLQGWGAGSVFLNARQFPSEKVQAWRAKIAELTDGNLANGEVGLLPGQENAVGGFPALGAPAFATAEGAGILVAGLSDGPDTFGNNPARIDGIRILGASNGGGIVVSGYAQDLKISNNRLEANSGLGGGAIRVGDPTLANEDGGVLAYTDAVNDGIRIHHNLVIKNGATQGNGGGVSLNTGADDYRVDNNWICGNFSQGYGGGIAHLGLSDGGVIEHNDVLFNESFVQGAAAHGGGIFVGGQTPLGTTDFNGELLLLSNGTGNVTINANRIHGNQAGVGDGGGIAIVSANGLDVVNSRIGNANNYNSGEWWNVDVVNNMITNNLAGLAGALSLQDSLEVHVWNNTIAHNDSTATAALAFAPGIQNESIAQPAGIVSRVHGLDMTSLLASVPSSSIPDNDGRVTEYRTFSDADLINDIVFGNRSFFWKNSGVDPVTGMNITGLYPANCPTATGCDLAAFAGYTDDLAVLDGTADTGGVLYVRNGLLTDGADDDIPGYSGDGNVFTTDPQFVNPVFNEGRDGLDIVEFTVLQVAGAFDEGGNFIQVAPSPLTLVDITSATPPVPLYDYHIELVDSPAMSAGQNVSGSLLAEDFDGDTRSNGGNNEIGADELPAVAPAIAEIPGPGRGQGR